MSDNIRAALLMMLSLTLLSVNDAAIKAVGMEVPLTQIIVLRNGVLAAVMVLVVAYAHWRWHKALALSRRDWTLTLMRSVGEAGAAYFYLEALVHIPFANVAALLQSAPLVVALGAALFLGEKVGWRRLSAILAGLVGVLIIIRPGPAGFDIYAIYVLISVLFIGLRDLTTRRLSRSVPGMTVTATTAILVLLLYAVLGQGTPWQPMRPVSVAMVLVASGLVLASYALIIQAMRLGEVSFVSPFRYTALLWALLLGLVFFGEWPDALTLVGSAIVVASGLFTFYREHRLSRRVSRPAATPPIPVPPTTEPTPVPTRRERT